jgi:DNA-binding PadR family transcriptional regulator
VSEDLDNLVYDFSRFYILTILYESPTHGYGIIQKFKRRVGKTLSPGLIYPFLEKLEEQGLITHQIKHVGEKEKKVYQLTSSGIDFCNRLFRRIAGMVSTALAPSLDVCSHCGCKVYEGGYVEEIEGVEMSFCCVHCAQSFKLDGGLEHDHQLERT